MNIKKKFTMVICFILVFVMLISSAPLKTNAEEKDQQVSDSAKKLADEIAKGITLKEYTWKDDKGKTNSAFFAELPQYMKDSDSCFIDNGDGTYMVAFNDNGAMRECQIVLKIDGKQINTSSNVYNYKDKSVPPLIEINACYDADRAKNEDYLSDQTLEEYKNKSIEVEILYEDDNSNAITATSDSVELTEDDVGTKEIGEDSPFMKAVKAILGFIFAPVKEALKLLERIYTLIILALGDGLLAMVSSAVGEPVTIDGVILGDVKKVSIDFWQDADGIGYMASILKDVVNQWYDVFTGIALAVYVMLLLIIGIKILFASTGAGKAKYKDLLKDWVVGICLLLLFPYVMKMLVNINDILIAYVAQSGNIQRTTPVKTVNDENIAGSFGGDEFLDQILPDGEDSQKSIGRQNTMLYIRGLAKEHGRIPLALIYILMIFQLIVILCVYYKRAFMVAFLIVIFPLVAMTYTIDKMTGGLAHTGAFNTWFKEFFVNVFVQLFHAVTYVIIVNAGVVAYINTENWFFMVLCISFLFQGEKILRKIFGVESAAGTMKDIGDSALVAYGAIKRFVPRGNKKSKKPLREQEGDDWSEEDDEGENDEDEMSPSTPRPPVTQGATQNMQAVMNAGTNNGAGSLRNAQATGVSKVRKVASAIGNAARSTAPKRIIGGAVNLIGAGLGGVMGATYGLASGDVGKAVTYGIGGFAAGRGLTKAITAPIRGISNAYSGRRLKKAVMRGDYDEAFKNAGLDMNSMEAKTADLIRKALAEQTSAAASRGEKVGEYKFWKTIEKYK